MIQKIRNNMELFRILVLMTVVAAIPVLSGCSVDELPDNRDKDYGYVQFKLYKEASYEPASKAGENQLDYLADAAKVKVNMTYGSQTISQTLVLSAGDGESAEYGLRSAKLQLLGGEYTIVNYTLYGSVDNELYTGTPSESQRTFTVTPGGLETHDLTVSVVPRGHVRFTLVKDVDADFPNATKSVSREYMFEEIRYFSLELEDLDNPAHHETFTRLPATYSVHFDGSDDQENGYQTASVACDSLISIPAGRYRVISYETYEEDNDVPLEVSSANSQRNPEFTIEDNAVTDVNVGITLYEADDYIQDNYVLKIIWEALDGPNWSYDGQNYNAGCNWDFNKDPDLWSYQPGVQVHPNGRIAYLDLSGFGISGHLPKEIGQLTELMELYLGTHSDDNVSVTRAMSASAKSHYYTEKSDADRADDRQSYKKSYMASHTNLSQMSPICALALKMHGLTSSAASSYEGMTQQQLFLEGTKTSTQPAGIKPMDVAPGVMHTGLLSLPPEIGKLTRLEKLNIANSPIYDLGSTDETGLDYTPGIAGLRNLTDLEIYNCPNLDEFPDIADLPKLVTVNFSYIVSDTHPDMPDGVTPITEQDVRDGLVAMSKGEASRSMQMIYCNGNSLTAFPAEMKDFADLSVVDFANNKITSLPMMGEEFDPSELELSNNLIAGFEPGADTFCDITMLSSISLSFNKLKEVPDIFRPKADLKVTTIDLSYNEIEGFVLPADLGPDEDYMYVETLNLGGNHIEEFPENFFDHIETDYIIMSACGLRTIPEGTFDGKYTESLVSLDLQYNRLTSIPIDFNATSVPYLYGVDLSYNAFSAIPEGILSCKGTTILGMRGQRSDSGERVFRTWPESLYQHTGLRACYLGSNDIRTVNAEQVSTSIYYMDISDNPNIYFDASGVCSAWAAGVYFLYYDRSQNIINCASMLQ